MATLLFGIFDMQVARYSMFSRYDPIEIVHGLVERSNVFFIPPSSGGNNQKVWNPGNASLKHIEQVDRPL